MGDNSGIRAILIVYCKLRRIEKLQNPYDAHFKKRKQVSRKTKKSTPSKRQHLPSTKRTRKRKAFPVGALVSCIVLLGLFMTAMHKEAQIINFLGKIEIGIFGKAKAQAQPARAKKKDKSGLDKFEEEKKAQNAAKKTWTEEEITLFTSLEKRKMELDQREEELKNLEKELKAQQNQLVKQLAEMKKLRGEISNGLEEKVQKDEERVDKLVAVYSNMKPQQAAKVMEKIDEELAIRVLSKMKKKSAAQVLNLLEPEKAKRLSEKYVGYISMK